MTERPTPNWQPLSQLPLIAAHIDAMVEGAAEHYQNLEAARPKPYVLDDYTVERVIKVFTTQQDDLCFLKSSCAAGQLKCLPLQFSRKSSG